MLLFLQLRRSCHGRQSTPPSHHDVDTPSRRVEPARPPVGVSTDHVSFRRCACARRAAAAGSRLPSGSRRRACGRRRRTDSVIFRSLGGVLCGSNARTARRPSKERVKHCRSATEQSQELQTFSFFFFLPFSVFLLSVLLTEEQGKRRNLAVGHQSSGLK